MTDTNCTRAGYDDTGRYRVKPLWKPPATSDDQCPECRSAPGEEHNQDCPECVAVDEEPAVNIPLDVQERLFDLYFGYAMSALEDLIAHGEVDLEELARTRLRSGFREYGSTMYTWTPERRRREVLEELADALVYLSSGPIE